MRAITRALSAAILILLAGAYIEVPGPWRALTPVAFGLSEIAPGIYTDVPERRLALLRLVEKSREGARSFFGPSDGNPTYIICVRAECATTFGFRARGLTVGHHMVFIAPDGLIDQVFLHERLHVELHRRMGPSDLLSPRFPAWFDEGLATALSRPRSSFGRIDAAASGWIREAESPLGWRRMRTEHEVSDLYRAAAVLVIDLQDRVGRHGLFDLIDRVTAGEDFDALYAEALGRRPSTRRP